MSTPEQYGGAYLVVDKPSKGLDLQHVGVMHSLLHDVAVRLLVVPVITQVIYEQSDSFIITNKPVTALSQGSIA